MAKDSYFQFPLCALSFGDTPEDRLNHILDYSVVEAGCALFRKLPASEQREFIYRLQQSIGAEDRFDPNNWLECAARYGAHVIGVIYSDFRYVIKRHAELRTYIAKFEERHGKDAKVRIKKKWLFDTRDHRGIKYREFSVLCAIYSVIGEKQLAKITRDTINRRALGYRTAAIMQAEIAHRTDGVTLLTERQLRDTIDRLHLNNFFARSTVSCRFTYYSIRLDREALRKGILDRRTYARSFHAFQSAEDQALTDKIKQRLAVTREQRVESLGPHPAH